jgi:hypothetical protein
LPFWCIEVEVDEGRATRFITAAMRIRRESIFWLLFVATDKKLPATARAAAGGKVFIRKDGFPLSRDDKGEYF